MTRAFALSALLTIAFASAALAEDAPHKAGATAEKGAEKQAEPIAPKKAVPKVDAVKGGAIAQAVCASCHAADGNAVGNAYPKLAAQHDAYLVKQLMNFKLDAGAKEPARNNAIMAGFAAALSDSDMKNVAAYYAAQQYKPSTAKNKDTVELAQKIWRGGIAEKNVPACAACHAPNGAGIPAQYPRLGGQFAEYTEAQLVAFRSGARKNNAPMTTIAARLSDAEIKALADYIAGLR